MEAASCLTCTPRPLSVAHSMLWTCIHLPDLPLQLALRGAAVQVPLVIISGGRQPRVLSRNPAAARCGIQPGMVTSAAWALNPHLIEVPRDQPAEVRALENLARWAGQFTPTVSLEPPESLLLEVHGCLRLFGGLRTLSARLRAGLEELGYHTVLAHAPTPSAAWLLARAGITTRILERHDLKRALAPLPLSLLNLPAVVMEKLTQVGVRTLGEYLRLPRDGLSRRFNPSLLDKLDRALGRLADPRLPYTPPPTYEGRLLLPVPIGDVEPLLFAVKRLVSELAGFLSQQICGVTRLRLDLHHEAGHQGESPRVTPVVLNLSVPSRDPARLLQLLRERLLALAPQARTEALSLRAESMVPLPQHNLTLFPEDQTQAEERLMLLEHLRARLGVEKVQGVSTFSDHRPERACRPCEPGKSQGTALSLGGRPLWLLHQPYALTCDESGPRYGGPLVLTTGPERIESGWWDGRDVRRDYFTARNRSGQLLWIFRERGPARGWYMHGLFG